MSLGRTDYPHPILYNKNKDFVDCDFSIDFQLLKEEITYFDISVNCSLNCPTLEEYLRTDKAEIILYIECPMANYRKIHIFEKGIEANISINKKDVYKDISVKPYIVAKQNIVNYSPQELNQELFKGYISKIRKGDILAFTDGFKINCDEYDPLTDRPSIFKISMDSKLESDSIQVSYDDDKITIFLSQNAYGKYNELQIEQNYRLILASLYVSPVLVDILAIIKHGESSDYEDYKWYKVINKRLKDLNVSLDNVTSLTDVANRVLPRIITTAVLSMDDIQKQLDRGNRD